MARPNLRGDALHFSVWTVGCQAHVLMKAPTRTLHGKWVFQRIAGRAASPAAQPRGMAPLFSPSGLVISLRNRQSRPLAHGIAYVRRLDHRARLSQRAWCGRRLRLWRTDDGVPRTARSGASLQFSFADRGRCFNALQAKQREYRRRLLHARWAVLLRARV